MRLLRNFKRKGEGRKKRKIFLFPAQKRGFAKLPMAFSRFNHRYYPGKIGHFLYGCASGGEGVTTFVPPVQATTFPYYGSKLSEGILKNQDFGQVKT